MISSVAIAELDVVVSAHPSVQGNHAVSRHGYVYEKSSAALKAWRNQIIFAARMQWGLRPPLAGPLLVWLEFAMPAPKRKVRELPTVRPDLDKLVRPCLDALTASAIYSDDAQVTELRATKRYAAEDEGPGVRIRIWKFSQLEGAPDAG